MRYIIIFFLLPYYCFSQTSINDSIIKNKIEHQVKWNTNILFTTNGLNQAFLNSFTQGGYISDKTKEEWVNLSANNNIVFSDITNSISYINKKNNYEINIADRNIINISFSSDLMRLVLFGNFNYQDKRMDISNTNIRINRFQQYKFNYQFDLNKINFKTGVSYLVGNYHTTYIIKSGEVYTAPYGTFLDVNYDMNAIISDTANINPFANNGNGFAIDLTIDFKIKDYDIQLYMNDIGSIRWNPSSIIYNTDSTFIFSGIEVENILNFNDSIIEEYTTDDIFTMEKKDIKSYIPGKFGFTISKNINNRIKYIAAGLNLKWQPLTFEKSESFSSLINQGIQESNYIPLIWISTIAEIKHLNIIPKISYGGYGGDLNLGTALSIGKKNNILIGTEHLEDIFNGDQSKAVSFYLQIIKQF